MPSQDHALTPKLLTLLPPDRFYLSKDEAAALAAQLQVTEAQLAPLLIEAVKTRARPVISHYQVGVVAKAKKSQNLLFGVNLEFAGLSLNQAVHGEQFAIALAHIRGEEGIESFTISAAPCGHCRQFMNEMVEAAAIKIILPAQPQRTLAELLPAAFGPDELGVKDRLLAAKDAKQGKPTRSLSLPPQRPDDEAIAEAAFTAYERSHAPYSKSAAGIALALHSGQIVAGSYLESVAFNPSLSPLQVALINLLAHGGDYSAIRRAVLVEAPATPRSASQLAATRTLLQAIAPQASLASIELQTQP